MTDSDGGRPPTDDTAPLTDAPPTDAPLTDEPPTYELARAELVEVVATLEAGGTSLEDSIRLWERAESLADLCETMLAGARARLADARPSDPTDT